MTANETFGQHQQFQDHYLGKIIGDGVDQRADEVGTEERELHEHRRAIAELEHILELRYQKVVHAGDEAPHEEEQHDNCE